ncbi:hypothetical protein TanjilG_09859 [Lupinus angustifolius]|uniref:Uncharacterized protein n=1 Tax=Lupinus angustifolius TaxID=3871 RepID=A0A4P1QWS3_LUPAN|nr:PREDICTED: uncharacterized protein LOC109328112 [Lupinus angustifolius]OIV96432.1 hypothetical protein TanjilG_09859 [Lupinus angustifolius]
MMTCSFTTTSSSIGNDSDAGVSSSETESAENEAHSPYNGPLHMMDSLQQVLPIRRAISKFYSGKSKSFTSLADASSSLSIKNMVKPENAYTRRRRNLMAFHHGWGKNQNSNFHLRRNSINGGISKRTISSSRSTLALAFALNYDTCSSSSSFTSEDSNSASNLRSVSPHLPPFHPRIRVSSASVGPSSPLQQNNFSSSSWRSFSFADLHHCATTTATMKLPASALGNEAAANSS